MLARARERVSNSTASGTIRNPAKKWVSSASAEQPAHKNKFRGLGSRQARAQSSNDAAELDEQTVSRGLHQPTAMFGNFGIDYLGADRPEATEGALFVRSNETQITRDIGG